MTVNINTLISACSLLIAAGALITAILKMRSMKRNLEDNHFSSVWEALNKFKSKCSDNRIEIVNNISEMRADIRALRRDVDKLLNGRGKF